jgi:hypothetical protein
MGNVFDVLYTVSIFEYIRKYGFNFLGGWAGGCISKVIVKEFKNCYSIEVVSTSAADISVCKDYVTYHYILYD